MASRGTASLLSMVIKWWMHLSWPRSTWFNAVMCDQMVRRTASYSFTRDRSSWMVYRRRWRKLKSEWPLVGFMLSWDHRSVNSMPSAVSPDCYHYSLQQSYVYCVLPILALVVVALVASSQAIRSSSQSLCSPCCSHSHLNSLISNTNKEKL